MKLEIVYSLVYVFLTTTRFAYTTTCGWWPAVQASVLQSPKHKAVLVRPKKNNDIYDPEMRPSFRMFFILFIPIVWNGQIVNKAVR
jgi:hypothetical protein